MSTVDALLAGAEKEIRALARKLGVKAWLVREALKSVTEGNGADGTGLPAASSAGSTGADHGNEEDDREAGRQSRQGQGHQGRQQARREAGQEGGRGAQQEGRRQARLITRADLAPRAPVLKDQEVEHEGYRRLVAARPCINCGIHKRSQAAHENAGKGKGLKRDDRRTFPLCADAPLIFGCHTKFDRYRLFRNRAEHIAMGAKWSKQTREAIRAEGLWPKDLDYLEG